MSVRLWCILLVRLGVTLFAHLLALLQGCLYVNNIRVYADAVRLHMF
jgi:hypothetical protein